jgi:hypothetical protein
MSFQKLNLCASTQVAFNVFHMFRGNTINQIMGNGNSWEQYAGSELGGVTSEVLQEVANMLQGDYSDIRVYDIETVKNSYDEVRLQGDSDTRRVQFIVRENCDRKIVFNVFVTRKYFVADMDSVDGIDFTEWKMSHCEIKVIESRYIGMTLSSHLKKKIEFKVSNVPKFDWRKPEALSFSELHSQIQKNIGGIVHVTEIEEVV